MQKRFCVTWYTIEIFIDATNARDPVGMFRATNKSINTVFETDYFAYNPRSLNSMIGIYNNGCDILVDNISITYGDAFFGTAAAEETTTTAPTTTAAPVTTAAPEIIEAPVTTAAPAVDTTSVPSTTAASGVEETTGLPTAAVVIVAVLLLVAIVVCVLVVRSKKLKLILIVCLAAALVIFLIAALVGGKDEASTPVPAVTTDLPTSTVPVQEAKEDSSGLPEMDYNDQLITILAWKEADYDEFNAETVNGELFNDAKYQRNLKVEDELGVKFAYNREVRGDASDADEFITHVTNSLNTGSKDFDIIAGYSQTMCTLSTTGLLYNLLDTDYLDFDREWWPKSLTEEFTINDKLCLCTGDIAPTTLYMMYAVFYNKEMITDYGLEDPHQLVANNQWTQEKFIEMSSGIYADLNGDGQKNDGDRFGYMTGMLHLDPWFYSIGAKMVEKNADGELIVSSSLSGEKTLTTIERLQNLLFASSDGLLSDKKNDAATVTHLNAFAQNNVLFTTEAAFRALQYFSVDGLTYGILPIPKYDNTQDDYVSLLRNTTTLFAIPFDSNDPDMISAVLQCYGYHSYKEITPAVFEQTLKLKYSDTELDAQMYDIIRSTITFDIGRFYSKVLVGQALFREAVGNNSGRWVSIIKTNTSKLTKGLEELGKAFAD